VGGIDLLGRCSPWKVPLAPKPSGLFPLSSLSPGQRVSTEGATRECPPRRSNIIDSHLRSSNDEVAFRTPRTPVFRRVLLKEHLLQNAKSSVDRTRLSFTNHCFKRRKYNRPRSGTARSKPRQHEPGTGQGFSHTHAARPVSPESGRAPTRNSIEIDDRIAGLNAGLTRQPQT